MLDLARSRGLLVLLPSLALAVGVVDQALRTSVGLSPRFLSPDVHLAPWDADKAGERLAAVARERRASKRGDRDAIVLGMSSAMIGIDTRLLDERSLGKLRWASLNGAGGHFEKISQMATFLPLLEPPPEVVIIAVHPMFLSRGPAVSPEIASLRAAASDPSSGALARATSRAKEIVKSSSWIETNRFRFNLRWRDALLAARVKTLAALGQKADAIFSPDPDPRNVPVPLTRRLVNPDEEAKRFLEKQRESYEREYGWFEKASYSTDGEQAAHLVSAISSCRELGARTGVVLMPESSPLRARVPDEAESGVAAVLSASFEGNAPPVLNLRAALPDELFADLNHLSLEGRRRTTERVADFAAGLAPR